MYRYAVIDIEAPELEEGMVEEVPEDWGFDIEDDDESDSSHAE